MPTGTPTQVQVTAGSGTKIEVIQDSSNNYHPVGVLEFVDANDNPILVSAATPLPMTVVDTASSAVNITAADVASTSTNTLLGQAFIIGAPTAASFASFAVTGESTFYIQVTGTWSATLVFERSADGGTTWVAFGCLVAGTNFSVSSTTTNGLFRQSDAAVDHVRVRCTAFVSGTVVVAFRTGPGIEIVHNAAPPPACIPYAYISSGSSGQDAQVIKSTPGIVTDIQVGNQASSARFLKIYDKATAPASTDTPIKVLTLPASGGNNPHLLLPIQCLNGIGIRITTGVAFNDTGAASSNDVNVNIGYK